MGKSLSKISLGLVFSPFHWNFGIDSSFYGQIFISIGCFGLAIRYPEQWFAQPPENDDE